MCFGLPLILLPAAQCLLGTFSHDTRDRNAQLCAWRPPEVTFVDTIVVNTVIADIILQPAALEPWYILHVGNESLSVSSEFKSREGQGTGDTNTSVWHTWSHVSKLSPSKVLILRSKQCPKKCQCRLYVMSNKKRFRWSALIWQPHHVINVPTIFLWRQEGRDNPLTRNHLSWWTKSLTKLINKQADK